MFSLSKPGRRKLYLLLPLLTSLLLAGCSQAQPDSAGGGPVPTAGSPAAASARPEGTAIPSAPADGMAASTSGAASAGAEAGAADATPPADPDGAGTDRAPSNAAGVTVTPAPASAAAGTKQPAAAASSVAATRPPATAAPASAGKPAPTPAGTKQPAAAAPSAAATPPPATAVPVNAVTLSIVGDKEHGTIFAAADVEVKDGESALELLKRITRKNKIQMEYQGAKSFAYVEGIDNLYEFDHGPESGWMYRVNGEIPGKGAGSYTLKPGDTVEWLYTLDLGKDVGAGVQ
ncbi:DUF4430 domain-containing protein [Paenibacillus sp. sgz5001063]|uniref:DUF4430 domain-containing protein n=1 Tax=Paenibacillus sp. sgz5001063 TaxID=3242474 RepID=UPI0036D3C357